MRVNLPAQSPAKRGETYTAIIKQLTTESLILDFRGKEIELPLARLTETQLVQLLEGNSLRLQLAGQQVTIKQASKVRGEAGQAVELEAFSNLSQVLLDLNIPVNEGTLRVAQGLIDVGLPLREELIWKALPFAKGDRLAAVLRLLQTDFPLTDELFTLAKKIKSPKYDRPLLVDGGKMLALEHKVQFKIPQWENRAFMKEGPKRKFVQKVLDLLVSERLQEALLNNQHKIPTYVFALPFLLDDDLYAGWVTIKDGGKDSFEDERAFYINLKIPTKTLGIVEVEIVLRGNNLTLTFWLQGELSLDSNDPKISEFRSQISEQGWHLGNIRIHGEPREDEKHG